MQKQSFQQLAELLPGGGLLLSLEGSILAASKSVGSTWGCDGNQLVGQSLQSVLAGSEEEITTFLQACGGCEQVIPLHAVLKASGKSLRLRGRRIDAEAAEEPAHILLLGEPDTAHDGTGQRTEEAVDVRDRLLAMLVHDFRNGLASVPMGFDVLEMEQGKSDTVSLLRRQIDRLVQLVDEVLDMSRLMRGKFELHRDSVLMQELLQELVKNLRTTFNQRHLELELVIPPEPIKLSVDPQRISQALKILVLERSRNMPQRGKVCIALSCDQSEVVLQIHDTGRAVAEELMPHVFDLIAQLKHLNSGHRTQFELGLALAGGLIALHGGQIFGRACAEPSGMETTIRLAAQVSADA